jgi:hypothetical protein
MKTFKNKKIGYLYFQTTFNVNASIQSRTILSNMDLSALQNLKFAGDRWAKKS